MEMKFQHKITKLVTPSESKALDDYSIREWKMDPIALMGSAATSIFQTYREVFKDRKIICVCGSGNNGGDGLALALLFHQLDFETIVFLKEGNHSKEFLYYLHLVKRSGIPILDSKEFQYHIEKYANTNPIIIDAIIGIGYKPPLSEEIDVLINSINSFRMSNPLAEVLSIDTPSGYCTEINTGYVVSDTLAEIGVLKSTNEFLKHTLKDYSFHPIGFPVKEYFSISLNQDIYYKLNPYSSKEIQFFSKRNFHSHKYSNGSACFIGGSEGMGGAILSACNAFHKMGGGISKIYSASEKVVQSIFIKDTSYMAMQFSTDSFTDPFFKKSIVAVIGPGLDKKDSHFDINSLLLSNKHFIIDAGGLELVKQTELHEKFILTPHPGEFTKLIDASHTTMGELVEQVRQYCLSCKVHLVYRSFITIVGTPDGSIYVWNYPNPNLAVMGTGDIFAGVLAYFIAKKYTTLLSISLTLSTLHLSKNMNGSYPSASDILNFVTEELHEK